MSDEYCIIDCAGFVDHLNKNRFSKDYLNNKEKLKSILPIDDIIMVSKFVSAESLSFKNAVEDFYSVFGCDGLKFLILLCIKEEDKDTLELSEKN